MTTIGPYTINPIPLYERRGNKIFTTIDSNWVIKLTLPDKDPLDNLEELRHVLGLIRNPPRNCISIPENHNQLFGTTAEGVWYAMARYDGHVTMEPFCKSNWRRIGEAVLLFLEDLHHTHGLAHLDIKAENILFDRTSHQFYVADFELLASPATNTGPLREKMDDPHYFWYYLGFGAEPDEPFRSWRMDFIMLGYLLARLTWNPEYGWSARDQLLAHARARTRHLEDDTVAGLIEQRDRQLQAGAALSVIAYMNRVAVAVPWGLKEPPGRELYRELRTLFQ